MANRVTVPVTNFETLSPPWSLASLDSDLLALQGALNDASLGYVTSGTDTGTANAYVIATPSFGTPSAYQVGMTVAFIPANTNTGNSTLTVGALGTQPILIAGAQVPPGALVAGNPVLVTYMGTAFQLISSPLGTSTNRFNAIGNPNFEVDQRVVHTMTANIANGQFLCDRWNWGKNGTHNIIGGSQVSGSGPVVISGFPITNYLLDAQLSTAQATLAAGDYGQFTQIVEGSVFRELSQGVHSITLVVYSTVAPLHFSVSLRDNPPTKSLVHLCTVPTANVWTTITIPNILAFPSGNFSVLPGAAGYILGICLGSGSTLTGASADSWLSGNYIAAPGNDNWFANPITSTIFYCAFVQHESGPLCTSLIDKPFSQNYQECLRYFQKSYQYGVAVGTASSTGEIVVPTSLSATSLYCGVPFLAPMAKAAVTLGIYSYDAGASGKISLRNNVGTVGGDLAVTAAGWSDKNLGLFTCSAIGAAYTSGLFHYTADTGW